MKQKEFIEKYIEILPRPEITTKEDGTVHSYYYELQPNQHAKRIDVEIELESDLSNFIAQISYASEDSGENKIRQKMISLLLDEEGLELV